MTTDLYVRLAFHVPVLVGFQLSVFLPSVPAEVRRGVMLAVPDLMPALLRLGDDGTEL